MRFYKEGPVRFVKSPNDLTSMGDLLGGGKDGSLIEINNFQLLFQSWENTEKAEKETLQFGGNRGGTRYETGWR